MMFAYSADDATKWDDFRVHLVVVTSEAGEAGL